MSSVMTQRLFEAVEVGFCDQFGEHRSGLGHQGFEPEAAVGEGVE